MTLFFHEYIQKEKYIIEQRHKEQLATLGKKENSQDLYNLCWDILQDLEGIRDDASIHLYRPSEVILDIDLINDTKANDVIEHIESKITPYDFFLDTNKTKPREKSSPFYNFYYQHPMTKEGIEIQIYTGFNSAYKAIQIEKTTMVTEYICNEEL